MIVCALLVPPALLLGVLLLGRFEERVLGSPPPVRPRLRLLSGSAKAGTAEPAGPGVLPRGLPRGLPQRQDRPVEPAA